MCRMMKERVRERERNFQLTHPSFSQLLKSSSLKEERRERKRRRRRKMKD